MTEFKPRVQSKISWGWLVVAAATFMTFGFYGASGSFGVFLKPIEETLNLTRASTSSAMSIFMAFTGITGIISGRLTDKYGPRIVIVIGVLIGSLGYLLMNWTNSLWQMYLFFGVMTGASMGTCFAPVIATVSKWFTHKRVLAVGITTAGMSLGQMALPVFSAHFIASNGWRLTYIVMAVLLLITAIPAVIYFGKKPPQDNYTDSSRQDRKNSAGMGGKISRVSRQWSAGEAVKTVPFWMFIIVGFVTATGFYILLVHIVAYAIGTGIAAVDAALILTFFNIGSIGAQFLVWYMVRKLSSRITLVMVLGLQALILFLLIGTTSFYWLIILGLVFGMGFGGSNTIRLSMISEIFGTRSAGAIIGLVSVAWSVGGVVGPILAGYIFDVSQSYNTAFLIGGLLLVVGAVAGFFLKSPDSRSDFN